MAFLSYFQVKCIGLEAGWKRIFFDSTSSTSKYFQVETQLLKYRLLYIKSNYSKFCSNCLNGSFGLPNFDGEQPAFAKKRKKHHFLFNFSLINENNPLVKHCSISKVINTCFLILLVISRKNWKGKWKCVSCNFSRKFISAIEWMHSNIDVMKTY